jgi:mannose-6-phosphate isomerase-like protein (cupin superfamily)
MSKPSLMPGNFAIPVLWEEVAEDWRVRGYDCRPFTDPPGQEWNGFVHSTNELVTVIDGRLRMTVGDQTVQLEPGDELFIPRGATHSVKNISPGTTRWLFGYD